MADDSQNQKDTSLFLQLVLTFQTAAWQQMGKLKSPVTDKIERDLNQAHFSIDILIMLRNKTEGNLSPQEKQVLDRVISELQLNYVDEARKPVEEPAGTGQPPVAEREGTERPEAEAEKKASGEKKPSGKPKKKSSPKTKPDKPSAGKSGMAGKGGGTAKKGQGARKKS